MAKAKIYYHDIGDYLSREEKLDIIHKLGSVDNQEMHWQILSPNEHNDWINQRNDRFSEFIPLAPEKKFDAKAISVFTAYSLGVATGRDSWAYNFSKVKITSNIQNTIANYNKEVDEYSKKKCSDSNISIDRVVDFDPQKIA